MDFAGLDDEELVGWLAGWVAKVAGTAEIAVAEGVDHLGTITVSVHGDLVRLALTAEATRLSADPLSRAIERGYRQAHRESLRQAGLVFDRVERDVAENPVVLARIRRLRQEHADPDGLRRMLKRAESDEAGRWDPSADPLRRRR